VWTETLENPTKIPILPHSPTKPMEETPGGSAQANPTDAMASPFPVVVDDGDGTAALRELSAPSAAAAASPDIVGPSSRPPHVPMLLDDDAPPALRRRLSVAPEPPGHVAPDIPQSLGSRAAVAVASESVLPPSLPVNFDASGSGILRSAVRGSIGPDIAVVAAATPPFATSSSAGSSSVPAFSFAASAHNPPGEVSDL
jgi:hypothetical protein